MDARVTAPPTAVEIGARRLSIEDVLRVARDGAGVALSAHPEFVRRIRSGAAYLERLLSDNGTVYGVNTGYGDSCTVAIPPALVADLPLHLTRFHGCGLGEHLDDEATLAVLVCRLNSLAQGYSGVRWELLQQLAALIEHRVLPFIPSEGSVGASGDLTPLSYVAAALIGERDVRHAGERRPAAEALAMLGCSGARNLALLCKINGTTGYCAPCNKITHRRKPYCAPSRLVKKSAAYLALQPFARHVEVMLGLFNPDEPVPEL